MLLRRLGGAQELTRGRRRSCSRLAAESSDGLLLHDAAICDEATLSLARALGWLEPRPASRLHILPRLAASNCSSARTLGLSLRPLCLAGGSPQHQGPPSYASVGGARWAGKETEASPRSLLQQPAPGAGDGPRTARRSQRGPMLDPTHGPLLRHGALSTMNLSWSSPGSSKPGLGPRAPLFPPPFLARSHSRRCHLMKPKRNYPAAGRPRDEKGGRGGRRRRYWSSR